MCRVLEVPRSGYYAWLEREPSPRAKANAELLEVMVRYPTQKDEVLPDGTAERPFQALRGPWSPLAAFVRHSTPSARMRGAPECR